MPISSATQDLPDVFWVELPAAQVSTAPEEASACASPMAALAKATEEVLEYQ